MILDERLEFADATAFGGLAGRRLIGDVVDLGPKQRDPGNGESLYLVLQVTQTFTSGTTSNVSFELASDAQAAIAVDGTATVHFVSATFVQSALVAGKVVAIVALPIEGSVYERFLGVIGNTDVAVTAGAINAFLTKDPPAWKAYDAPNQA